MPRTHKDKDEDEQRKKQAAEDLLAGRFHTS